MGPPVRDRASQDHRCVRRRGRRRRHHHCPTTDAGTTSYGNAFAERWIGPGRECLSPHHMIGFSAPPQVMAVVTVNSTSASARTDDRRNHASPGLVTSLSTESTAPVHGRIGSLRRAARVSLCRPCRPCRRSGPRSSPVCVKQQRHAGTPSRRPPYAGWLAMTWSVRHHPRRTPLLQAVLHSGTAGFARRAGAAGPEGLQGVVGVLDRRR
jgi:hypothetical protein